MFCRNAVQLRIRRFPSKSLHVNESIRRLRHEQTPIFKKESIMDFQIPLTNWLQLPEKGSQAAPRLCRYRKSFSLEAVPPQCRIKISADTRYKLYVNGKLSAIGPVKGDGQVWYADTVELSSYLHVGENILAVEVLSYPAMQAGNQSLFTTGTPGLYVLDLDGFGLSADAAWKCLEEPDFAIVPENFFFAPLHILENRRGDAVMDGWRESGYHDEDWESARSYTILDISQASVPGDLSERTIPAQFLRPRRFEGVKKLRRSDASEEAWNAFVQADKPLTLSANSVHTVELDAGEELTGFLSLRLHGGKGAKITLLTAESYVANDEKANADLIFSFPTKGDRADAENGVLYGFRDSYTAAGFAGEERYEPFWFRCFRYVGLTVETAEEPLTLTGFDFIQTGYPLAVKSYVETSDESLKGIWNISLRSLQNCMHETYEDCPFYEQLQYAMDSRSQILYTYAISGDDRLARKCMEDFRRSQRPDGMINCSWPTTRANVIPGFSIFYILMLEDHMMYVGDRDFLRGHLGAMDGVLEYFRRHLDARSLVGPTGGPNMQARYWSFIDWTDQWRPTTGVPDAVLRGPITMESFLYILGLTAAAHVNRWLNREDTAKEYEARAESVRAAIRRECRGETGMIQDGPGVEKYSQHGQVFAILTGTISPEEGTAFLEETMNKKNEYAQCSVAMAFYLFRAMEKTGLYARMDECWETWRNMLRLNLTTCVEDNVNQRSDCHAWGAAALYELPAVTLGVRPAAPGFERIAVRPIPGYLSWARGQVTTPHGPVKVQWKRLPDGKLDLQVEAPEGEVICVED